MTDVISAEETMTARAGVAAGEAPPFSVDIQSEYDLCAQTWRHHLWVNITLSIRTSGLLAALGPENLHTLITLATYTDTKGVCAAREEDVAADLRVDRSIAIRRLHTLCAFRWDGRPLVTRTRAADGRWIYTINQGGLIPGGH